MKSIQDRLPEMIAEKKKTYEKKKKEKDDEDLKECTFTPTRLGASVSDKYLKRMGRDKSTPDDFINFKEEKLRRNIQRKNIIDEIESRELTFKPQISEKSRVISERLKSSNSLIIDPTTKLSTGSTKKDKTLSYEVETCLGPPLILESEHPYKHNTCEYTTVNIPGAFSYSITFDQLTETENVHDFIKFYFDDNHTDFYGCNKYSGGLIDVNGRKTANNWPGVSGHPPLLIPASKFVFHFKSNATINGWGFKMIIVPTVSVSTVDDTSEIYGQPSLVSRNKQTPKKEVVHERLYKKGLEKFINDQNIRKESLQATLNVKLKISEKTFGPGEAKLTKPISKVLAGPALTDLLVDDDEKIPLTIIEFDESYRNLWKCLVTCTK